VSADGLHFSLARFVDCLGDYTVPFDPHDIAPEQGISRRYFPKLLKQLRLCANTGSIITQGKRCNAKAMEG
jgi:hypothetical protein